MPSILDNLGTIASIASLPALVVSYLALIRRPGAGRTIVLFIAVPIAIIAYAADVSDRLGWIKLRETGDVITSWGVTKEHVFLMGVNSRLLTDFQKDYKLMEIIQIPYANIDRMTDTNIEKSVLYTITGGPMIVALTLSSPSHLPGVDAERRNRQSRTSDDFHPRSCPERFVAGANSVAL